MRVWEQRTGRVRSPPIRTLFPYVTYCTVPQSPIPCSCSQSPLVSLYPIAHSRYLGVNAVPWLSPEGMG